MKILYYTWGDIIKEDIEESLKGMGHDIKVIEHTGKNYVRDAGVMAVVEEELETARKNGRPYDCIFSCNFLPILSKAALRQKTPYASWTFDSPCLTMYSEMIFNPYNYIFHFDSSEVARIRRLGVSHIYHLPLGVNVKRVQAYINSVKPAGRFVNDGVAFMGNLYNDLVDFIESAGLPDYEKGYVSSIVQAQLCMDGSELLEEMLDDALMERLRRCVSFTREDEFFTTDRDMILNMLEKNMSSQERINILQKLADRLPVTLYTPSVCNIPGVDNRGYLGYSDEMPLVFANSSINLNIKIRCIRTAIPLRALDVMGAGGFLLTNYCPELAEYMNDGEDYVTFYGAEDCCEKAKYYLKHDSERRKIAQNGLKKVSEMFTYEKKFGEMFDILRREFG